MNVIVMAKAPVAGQVKTRLCPPCTPEAAALIAAAALADTLEATGPEAILALSGTAGPELTGGRRVVPQRGVGLGERLVHAFADGHTPGRPTLLIGMDTPQVTPALLTTARQALADADAVLGLATDGGWWALGLHDPTHAEVLRTIAMSTAETGARTRQALLDKGLRVTMLPELCDVDTAGDAYAVAALCRPESRFARAVTRWVPA
ncbi:TIGR04282 family arsenosugar biosynthesis glycosyltransferase [Micromonosporaceae bacterium Da 78-11]